MRAARIADALSSTYELPACRLRDLPQDHEEDRRTARRSEPRADHGHDLRAQLETGGSARRPGPTTRTGDYSDVCVLDADGRRIPWSDVSRIDDDKMRALMRDIVNRLYTFHLCADEPGLQAEITPWMAVASRWDEPVTDKRMLAHRAGPR